jgi:hypothetical protein
VLGRRSEQTIISTAQHIGQRLFRIFVPDRFLQDPIAPGTEVTVGWEDVVPDGAAQPTIVWEVFDDDINKWRPDAHFASNARRMIKSSSSRPLVQ